MNSHVGLYTDHKVRLTNRKKTLQHKHKERKAEKKNFLSMSGSEIYTTG